MDKSIWVDYHRDENGNPTAVKIDNDIKIVSPLHNTICLQEIPDKNHGIVAVCDDARELPICDNLDELTVNNCYIDYLTGKVYFHQDYSGKPVVFNYYGMGIELLGASRIYDEHSLDGKTIRETLQDMIDKGRECIKVLKLFGDLATMIKRIEKDIENAKTIDDKLVVDTNIAKPLQESLHQDIEVGTPLQQSLHQENIEGKTLQPVLQKTIDDATVINTTLNTSLDKAKPSIDLINSAGNPHYDIKVADWVANTDTNSTTEYMFDIVHTLQTKYIQVNIDDTVNGLNIIPDCRKIDNNTIRIFSNEKVDVTVTLSARYYDGGSGIANEVVIARGTFDSLGKRLDNIDSQLEDIATDDTFKNNHFKSHQISYIGVQNEAYVADNASRLYILPKDHVSTGVGGAIKVFGDDFSVDDLNYRDLGIYFCADQLGQLGFHDVGAFYINSKVNGEYNLKNPDIIFSFQDGADIGGRFVRKINDSQTDSRAIFIVGEGEPASLKDESAVMELQGNAVFQNGKALKWLNGAGTSIDCAIYYTTDNRLRLQGLGSIEMFANNSSKMILVDKYTRFDNALICNTQVQYTGTETSINAVGTNLIKLSQSSATNVSSITGGQHGQELVLYFANNYTTIKQNNVTGGIALAGGTDFVGTSSDMLTLLYVSDRWVEKCRSIN